MIQRDQPAHAVASKATVATAAVALNGIAGEWSVAGDVDVHFPLPFFGLATLLFP
jgi:hypothetical protein